MTWRTEIFVSSQWGDQGLVFASRPEAEGYGAQLTALSRAPYRAVATDEPVNYAWNAGVLSVHQATPVDVWTLLMNRLRRQP